MNKKLLSMAVAIFAFGIISAQAQLDLVLMDISFSGGNGTPLTVTVNAPTTFYITTANSNAPLFTIKGITSFTDGDGTYWAPAAGTTLTYSINGGPAQSFSFVATDYEFGSIAPEDLGFGSYSYPGVAVGDTVTLNAGTFTTDGVVPGLISADSPYSGFVSDWVGVPLNGEAPAVPEPSQYGLGIFLAVAGFIAWRRFSARAA